MKSRWNPERQAGRAEQMLDAAHQLECRAGRLLSDQLCRGVFSRSATESAHLLLLQAAEELEPLIMPPPRRG